MNDEQHLYVPLYDTLYGGGAHGFVCLVPRCGKLTKTEIGMWTHLLKAHGIERQPELLNESKQEAKKCSVSGCNQSTIHISGRCSAHQRYSDR